MILKIDSSDTVQFDDAWAADAKHGHRRIASVTMGPCAAGATVTYLAFEYKDHAHPRAPKTKVEHGKLGNGKSTTWAVGDDDYIDAASITTWKRDSGMTWRTRISSISFSTQRSKKMSCGNTGGLDSTVTWSSKEGEALLYLSGGAGDALDNITGHFINIVDY